MIGGHCSSCSAPIDWAHVQTKTGRTVRMPLDPEVRADGNLACYVDATGTLRGRTLPAGEHPAGHEQARVSHFATCPQADRHRRTRPTSALRRGGVG